MAAQGAPFGGATADGTLVTKEREQQFSLPVGISGLLGPSSRMTVSRDGGTLTLRKGSLLVDAAGSARIDAGGSMTVRLLAGSCLMFLDERSVTVVALSAPVTVTRGDRTWILPSGYQLQIDGSGEARRAAVPDDWMNGQMVRSSSLPVAQVPSSDSLRPLLDLLHSLEILSIDSVSTAMALPSLADDPPLALLAAVRLSFQNQRMDLRAADTLSTQIEANVASSELAFALPALALSTLTPLPSRLIAAWIPAASRLVAEDPVAAASLLHDTLLALPSNYQHAGYPRQALLWRDAISQVNVLLSSLLQGTARSKFTSDVAVALREIPLSPQDASLRSPDAAGQSDPQFTLSQLTYLTHQLLLSRDVLHGASVSISADAENADCARVEGVYIAALHRDVPYAFSYCPLEQFIRTIERDGERLPNDMPVEKFFGNKNP